MTNAKPRDCPLSRSITTDADSQVPACAKELLQVFVGHAVGEIADE